MKKKNNKSLHEVFIPEHSTNTRWMTLVEAKYIAALTLNQNIPGDNISFNINIQMFLVCCLHRKVMKEINSKSFLKTENLQITFGFISSRPVGAHSFLLPSPPLPSPHSIPHHLDRTYKDGQTLLEDVLL